METYFKLKVSIVFFNAFPTQWLAFSVDFFVNFSAKQAFKPSEHQNFGLKGSRPNHTTSPSFFA